MIYCLVIQSLMKNWLANWLQTAEREYTACLSSVQHGANTS